MYPDIDIRYSHKKYPQLENKLTQKMETRACFPTKFRILKKENNA